MCIYWSYRLMTNESLVEEIILFSCLDQKDIRQRK